MKKYDGELKKYYVCGVIDDYPEKQLDLGMEVRANNPYMAAIIAYKSIEDDFMLDDPTITDVDIVEVRSDK